MADLSPDLTPKWAPREHRPHRHGGGPVIAAIVLTIIAALIAVIVATKYKNSKAGHEKQPAVLLREKK